jgi:guanylate kinase
MGNNINFLLVLSGPSGVGKTTIAKEFAKRHAEFVISVSATTRPGRSDEKNNIDYIFLSDGQFKEWIAEEEFLEYEQVHGYYYGTPKKRIDDLQRAGKSIIFDIDVKGAMNIIKRYPGAIMVFLKPPSFIELVSRLQNRDSDNSKDINKRLERLSLEYDYAAKFDYIIINDNLEKTIKKIENIIVKKREERKK